jgi:hypothetical protein
MLSGRRFRLLLGTWGTYWLLLAAFGLGPLALAIIRATSGPNDNKSSVNASFGDGVLSVTVVNQGHTTYTSSMHFLTAALWIAGPPLVAWLAFFIGARREAKAAAYERV